MVDNPNNFEELIKLADKAENDGDFQKMVQYLNLSLQYTDNKKPILERLLSYHLNDINPSKAIKILKDLITIEPNNPTYYKQAVSILFELGKVDYAQKLAKIAYSHTTDSYFEEIFKSNNEIILIDSEISTDVVPLLFTLFSGREGVYARQWKNNEGQVGYVPLYEPLNEKAIINHLNGNITIGIYQHRLDSTVTWICFDIDIAKHVLNNALQNDNYFKELDYATQRTASEIYDEASRHNIPVYIEHSGYKGRHCWIFLSKPIPARIAKRFGDVLKSNLKTITPEISVELFPKQNFVKTDGLGNLVKLPLGINLANGKRSYFVDKKGVQVKDPVTFLKNVEKVDEQKLIDYLNYYRVEQVYTEYGKSENPPPKEKITFTMPAIKYNLDNDKYFQYLIFKCPVLKEVYTNAIRKNELTYDEMIVLTHSVGHLDTGVEAVNSIFSKCFNISADKYLKSPLKGNPISCAKIRMKLPNITSMVNCNCQFENITGLYPSPLLHLNTKDVPAKLPSSIDVSALNFQNILDSYINLKKQLYEITLIIKDYEEKFETLFKTSGVDLFNTPAGKFRRVVDENGKVTYKLDV